ncbi:uroporphyrinogen-III synthase, partial [Thermus scotoductus]
PSAARAYALKTPRRPKAACIGPSTGEEVRRLAFVVWEVEEQGLYGLSQAIFRGLYQRTG